MKGELHPIKNRLGGGPRHLVRIFLHTDDKRRMSSFVCRCAEGGVVMVVEERGGGGGGGCGVDDTCL